MSSEESRSLTEFISLCNLSSYSAIVFTFAFLQKSLNSFSSMLLNSLLSSSFYPFKSSITLSKCLYNFWASFWSLQRFWAYSFYCSIWVWRLAYLIFNWSNSNPEVEAFFVKETSLLKNSSFKICLRDSCSYERAWILVTRIEMFLSSLVVPRFKPSMLLC